MTSNNSLTARLEELRSGNPPRLHSENTTGHTTPSFRYSGSFMSPPQSQTPIETPNLQRRFTTDLSKMQGQNITPIGQPPANTGVTDQSTSMFKKAQLLERKKQEYEMAAEKRKQFQAQLQFLAQQESQEKEEIEQMTRELARVGMMPSTQERNFVSEPSTPPEREGSFSSIFSRNRYSASSYTSPPAANTRSSRSNSQVASPPSGLANMPEQGGSEGLPSKSVPGSRRGSTDRVSAFIPDTNGSARRSGGLSNRYSMPTTNLRGRQYDTVPEHSPTMDMEHINTASFLFDDEDKTKDALTSPELTQYLQMSENGFPVLIRQDKNSGSLSASSAALDLAYNQTNASPGGLDMNHARAQRWSLQHQLQSNNQMGHANNSRHSNRQSDSFPINHASNRHSLEAGLAAFTQSQGSVSSETHRPSLPNSYSTSDVPTFKEPHASAGTTPPKAYAQQKPGQTPTKPTQINPEHLHGDVQYDRASSAYQQLGSLMTTDHSNSTAPGTASSPTDSMTTPTNSFGSPMNLNQLFFAGYGMQPLGMGMNPAVTNPIGYPNQMHLLQQNNAYTPYTNYAQQSRYQDGQPRSMQNRRAAHLDDSARFTNVRLESLRGEILNLCKDQHGCRYLQKKLEDRSSTDNIFIIFNEVSPHVVELMIDPFGNYLCQKLLESTNDEQRTILVNNAAPEMVKIALNSHGTRALQKMIEFVTTQEQIQTVIKALQGRVVELIQHLNGNHVIQKCLNHLSAPDAQFIFAAVGDHCVVVGTHRHGCCVLQRCIDHASGPQKAHLISQITDHAFHLVQDPFGNYVLQYIIDLQEPCFTDPLCATFQGQIPQLSKQKFSSNVIEKCLRGAATSVTKALIEEMLNPLELDKMLRDSYANYVVQTAMDYADSETKMRLVEAIRPLLPAVRHTPHGRRISTKIMTMDGQGRFSGSATPNDRSTGQIPLSLQMSPPSSTNPPPAQSGYSGPSQQPFAIPPNGFSPFGPSQYQGMPNGQGYMAFGSENMQNTQQQSYARMPQVNGGFF